MGLFLIMKRPSSFSGKKCRSGAPHSHPQPPPVSGGGALSSPARPQDGCPSCIFLFLHNVPQGLAHLICKARMNDANLIKLSVDRHGIEIPSLKTGVKLSNRSLLFHFYWGMKNRDLKITLEITLSNNKLLIRITTTISSNDNTQGHLTEP